MVVPSASLLVPLTMVEVAVVMVVITGAAVVATVTELETRLIHLPGAVAFAVTRSPSAKPLTATLQFPPVTVLLPFGTSFVNKLMTVPLASVLVPSTVGLPGDIGEEITGALVRVVVVVKADVLAAEAVVQDRVAVNAIRVV